MNPSKRKKAEGQPTSTKLIKRGSDGRILPGSGPLNEAGRPSTGTSWREVVERVGNMTGKEAAEWMTLQASMADSLRKMPEGVTLRELVVLAAFVKLLNDPEGRLLGVLMDREDGKPEQKIDTGNAKYLIVDQ